MRNLTTLCVLLSALMLTSATYAQPRRGMTLDGDSGRRVALVIGNNAYETAPLKNPVNDARDIAQELAALGFEVIHKQDLSQRDMKRAIRDFGAKIRGGGVGLFYFAGHGVQVRGRNYLIPVDAKVESEEEIEYEGVDAGFVLAQMDSAGNGMNIMILDACRNNPFARSFRAETRGLAQMDAPSGTLIAYATAPGSVASDGGGKNGLYTQELLRSLGTPGLSIEEVFKRVRVSVRGLTGGRQTPWEASSLTGDFYFYRGGEVTASAAGPSPAAVDVSGPSAAPANTSEPSRGVLPVPDEGVVVGSTYTNKFFGFSLTFPAAWTVQSKEVKEMMQNTGKQLVAGEDKNLQNALDAADKNSFNLLAISEQPLGAPVDYNPTLMCMAERVSFFPGVRRGRDYLFNVRKVAAMSQVKVQFGEIYTENVGGVEFDVMPQSLTFGTSTVKQKFYATVRNGFALAFIISYHNDEHLAEFNRMLRTVKFK